LLEESLLGIEEFHSPSSRARLYVACGEKSQWLPWTGII